MKNVVIDYLTTKEVCEAIGIKANSTALLKRWIDNGKIKGAKKFGQSWAIPVEWVKAECLERGIDYKSVELQSNQVGVKLFDYIPLIDYVNGDKNQYDKLHAYIRYGKTNLDYIRFYNTYGVRK